MKNNLFEWMNKTFIVFFIIVFSCSAYVFAETNEYIVSPTNWVSDSENIVKAKMESGENWVFVSYIKVSIKKVDYGTFRSDGRIKVFCPGVGYISGLDNSDDVSSNSSEIDYSSGVSQISVYFHPGFISTGTSKKFTISLSPSDGGEYYMGQFTVEARSTKLGAPTGINTRDYSDKIKISWNSVSGGNNYKVFRNTSNNRNGASRIAGLTLTNTYYYDYDVTPGIRYYYWVKAASNAYGDNESDFSSYAYEKIEIPDIMVDNIWTNPSNPEVSYRTQLYARIKNVGVATASNITLKYYIDGNYVGQDTHSSLSSGSTQTEYYSYYNFSSGGNHYYKVVIDSVSGETNTSNNEKTVIIPVTEPPNISASPSSVSCRASGETESSYISSNVSWSASDDRNWISTSSSSSRVNITCQRNTSTSQRSGRVTVSGSGASDHIDVIQEGASPLLTVNRSSVSFSHSGGNEAIDVSSNISWNVSESFSWISVVPSSGTNNSFFQISCDANTSVNERSGSVTVSGSGISRRITVSQSGAPELLDVNPTTKNFQHTGGNSSINVNSNVSWNVIESSTWLSASKSGNSFSIQCSANNSTSQRSTIITVSGGGLSKQVQVIQSPAPERLELNPTSNVFSDTGGSVTINVSSNISWNVIGDHTWLSIQPSTGDNDGSFSVNCQANPTIKQRSAIVNISGSGLSKQLQITQNKGSESLTVNPTSKNFPISGGKLSISVASNTNWNVLSNDNWLSVNPSSGSNNGSFDISCSANSQTTERSGSITVDGEEISVHIQITQEAVAVRPILSVEPSFQSVPAVAGTTSFDIANSGTGSLNWLAEVEDSASSWISISNTALGIGSGSILVSFNRNDDSLRAGQIIISSAEAENSPITVEVRQEEFENLTLSGQLSFMDQYGTAVIQAFESTDTEYLDPIDTQYYELLTGITEIDFSLSLPEGLYQLIAFIDNNDNLLFDKGESYVVITDPVDISDMDVDMQATINIPLPPLSDSGISIDMDISTLAYDNKFVSNTQIEASISASLEGEKWVGVVGQNVTNLDTCQIEIHFDPERLEFITGVEGNPAGGINNLLNLNGGTTIGFQAIEYHSGLINIANSIVGEDSDIAPEGSGILALLKFKALDDKPLNKLTIKNAYFLNTARVNEKITQLSGGCFNCYPQWDFSGDGITNYLDLGEFADHWLFTDDQAGWEPKYNLSPETKAGTDLQIIDYMDLSILADHWLETSH